MSSARIVTRRQLLAAIGVAAGAGAMFDAMEALGQVASSEFREPPRLSGARSGSSVLILGAGLAGLVAALELRQAGYKVQVLEYQNRVGGRNWTLRGGDTYTELGGATQRVRFANGNYFNPGPWRIPSRHGAILHYCRRFGVAIEPIITTNGATFIHSSRSYSGKPQRYQHVESDFIGHVSELLAKAVDAGSLDQRVQSQDRERLLAALHSWGRLDDGLNYASNLRSARHRGFDHWPGAGIEGAPTPSTVAGLRDVLDPEVWKTLDYAMEVESQPTMFQLVGGMDMIGRAFGKHLKDAITLNARVTRIAQLDKQVAVTFEDTNGGAPREARADWCICTLPLTVLGQMDVQVTPQMLEAIRGVPYAPHVRIGLEFKRRFWEEDDAIFGGTSWTDQSIRQITYPSERMGSTGPATLIGAYQSGMAAYELAAMTPEARIEAALSQGEKIHPQYRAEYLNGASVAWHRVPWMLGCRAEWSKDARDAYYNRLCTIDGRLALAGDHCSHLQGWQEGALLSGIDAAKRIHMRAAGSTT